MWHYRLIACLTALGLIGKSVIEGLPDRSSPREIPSGKPVLLFKKFRNRGLSLGLLEKHWEVVKYGPLLIECLVLLRLSRLLPRRGRRIKKTAPTLVPAGDGSNLFDYFSRGYVVDYFLFMPKRLCRLVFNLGDPYIATGVVVLSATGLVRSLRRIGIKEVKY